MSEQRDALLARVVDYYAEHGVRDTSLRTLAAGIGTSQRMLHHHFGNRADVLTAVIDAIAGSQAEQIRDLFAREQDPFEAGRRNWVDTLAGAEKFGALWFELATHAMRGEPYAADLGRVMVETQLREFTRVYATRTEATTAAHLARLTLAVGQGLVFDYLIDRDRDAADAAVLHFTEMVRRELAAPGNP
ncbi:TetR/AcrR family transcriptional regulator [Knoellia remsis]|uniref:TetR/AcrR family transcriptional regulator n=1 Tax=Knoellia remsis TaxID=407159 RepID=UPI001475ABFF|nr:TetR/AcrR family transcriptional regulator [Knoellia remsis]